MNLTLASGEYIEVELEGFVYLFRVRSTQYECAQVCAYSQEQVVKLLSRYLPQTTQDIQDTRTSVQETRKRGRDGDEEAECKRATYSP
jgi:CRP-like cAMP-binding protein